MKRNHPDACAMPVPAATADMQVCKTCPFNIDNRCSYKRNWDA